MNGFNLSQTQIAMTEQVCPGSARNTISLKLHLPDHTPQKVKEAADIVLDSADIFAASLNRRDGEWFFSLDGRKISECIIEKKRAADLAEEYMEVMDRQPFNMEQCLYRAEVIPFSGGGVFLYVRFHHVIIDGYGMSLFVQKVLDVLAGKKIIRSVFFSENKPIREEAGFWQSYFAGAEFESAVFPQKVDGNRVGNFRISVPEKLMREVETFGEREKISIPYIFSAAYALYLARATGKKDAVFLMPRLNRTLGQMGTLGCYTLLVPVRVQVEGAETFADLCREVKRASREASAHKECGFDKILSALRDENMIGESLSEYVFNYYRYSFSGDFHYSVRFSVAGDMSNHMTFNLFPNEKGGLDLQADYQESIYTKEKAGYFCDAILTIAAEGVAGQDVSDFTSADKTTSQKLSHIKILGKAECGKITLMRGKTFPIEKDLTIPSLFRNAVEKYKEAPALYAGEHTFTFRQLDDIDRKSVV